MDTDGRFFPSFAAPLLQVQGRASSVSVESRMRKWFSFVVANVSASPRDTRSRIRPTSSVSALRRSHELSWAFVSVSCSRQPPRRGCSGDVAFETPHLRGDFPTFLIRQRSGRNHPIRLENRLIATGHALTKDRFDRTRSNPQMRLFTAYYSGAASTHNGHGLCVYL
jgi:hypothetical protein